MRLTRLAAENWMAYETLDLDFGAVTQVAITGRNNHGKSALLDALEWCLWGKVGRDIDQRSADKFVRRGFDLMSVTVEFEAQGHEVSVRREKPVGKTSTLLLAVDGVEQRGHVIGRKGDELLTLDETQARIDALVGLGYDAITAGPFMAQEQASFFMRALPRDRKDLLIKLLGVDAYEPLAKVAANEVTAQDTVAATEARHVAEWSEVVGRAENHARRLADAQVELDTARAQEATAIAAYTMHRDAYLAVKAQADLRAAAEERWQRAQTALARAEANVATAKERLAAATTSLDEPAPSPKLPPRIETHVIEESGQRAEQMLMAEAERLRTADLAASFRADVERAMTARSIAATVPCGASGAYAACRFLTDVPSDETVAAAVKALENAEGLVAALDGTYDAVGEQRRHADLLRQVNDIERQYRDADHATQVWRARRESAKDVIAAAAEVLKDAKANAMVAEEEEATAGAAIADWPAIDLEATQTAAQTAQEAARAARAAREGCEAAIRPLEAEGAVIEHSRAQLATARAAMTAAEAKAATMRLLAAAWHRDGIPTSLIEAAVPRLEAKANAVLERMPEDLVVSLRTQRPTKKGGMAETLDVVVAVDGWESDYALLSVGARFRVDLALRLALADLLTSRTGATIDTLWLDEPLAALDEEGREAAVETLAALGDDFGLIVIVSHHDDMNDRFPARIRVTKEDGVSSAALQT